MRRLASLLLIPVAFAIVSTGARGQERNTSPVSHVQRRRSHDPRHAGGDGAGPRHVARAGAALPGSHRAVRRRRSTPSPTVSRTALDEADLLDRERAFGRVRGPLHGIPIAVKDIINTTNMPTTGGAVAFAGSCRPTTRRSSPI